MGKRAKVEKAEPAEETIVSAVRITNELTEAIVLAALADAFDKHFAKLAVAEEKLGEAVIKFRAGRDYPKIKKIPEGWLPKRNWLMVNVGFHVDLHFKENRSVPARFTDRSDIPASSPLWEQIRGHAEAKRELGDKRDEMRSRLRALIRSCSTLRKLVEAWPESRRFIPKWAFEQRVTGVPAQVIEAINADLSKIKAAA